MQYAYRFLTRTAMLTAWIMIAAVSAAQTPGHSPSPDEALTLRDLYDKLQRIEDKIEGGDAGLPKTGQTAESRPGDDGTYQKGAAPPDPRFTVTVTNETEEVVTDNLTGLMWTRAPHALAGNDGTPGWNAAIDFCNALSFAGYDDWRLPNARELHSLIDYGRHTPALPEGHPFRGVQVGFNWTSSSFAGDGDYAWVVSPGHGSIYGAKKTAEHFVWPVRGGQ